MIVSADAVYQHVQGQIASGATVGPDNRYRYGPRLIAAALKTSEKHVKRSLDKLVTTGRLIPSESGFSVSSGAASPPRVYQREDEAPPPVGIRRDLPLQGRDDTLSDALRRRLGIFADGDELEPATPMDWALHWARKGVDIFPVERFLGTPLVPHWYSSATYRLPTIIEWWSENPTADIAAVPDKTGNCVLVAAAEQDGIASLAAFEAEHGALPSVYRHSNRWGDIHVWLKGYATTSHHKLGRGLHLLGAGHAVMLPDSWAPDDCFADMGEVA